MLKWLKKAANAILENDTLNWNRVMKHYGNIDVAGRYIEKRFIFTDILSAPRKQRLSLIFRWKKFPFRGVRTADRTDFCSPGNTPRMHDEKRSGGICGKVSRRFYKPPSRERF